MTASDIMRAIVPPPRGGTRGTLRHAELTERVRPSSAAPPAWIRKVNRELEGKGAKVRAQYAVLGPYDFVTILEAPDNETISAISVEMGARGSVSMMTMPAIPLDTFINRLKQGGKSRGGRRRRR